MPIIPVQTKLQRNKKKNHIKKNYKKQQAVALKNIWEFLKMI